MMRRQHLRVLLPLALTIVALGTLTAGSATTPDHYTVSLASRRLANDVTQPARTFQITRPDEGTFVRGVVIVKTRAGHGDIKGDHVLGSSTVNVTMNSARVTEVGMFSASAAQRPNDPTVRATGLDRTYTIRYDEPIDPYDMCKRLMQDPDVEFAVPMRIHKLCFTPNDPRFPNQSFLQQLKVPQAWDITKGKATVLIAIIDSGIDWQHEDLAPNIFENIKEIGGNGIDDDGNGYVDDIRGWDFVGNADPNSANAGIYQPDNDPRIAVITGATHPHGTIVSGNAAAATNNSKGVAGIGSNCKILPIKCGSDNAYAGGIYNGYRAIEYAANMGANIINCSWGGEGADPAAQSAIDYAISKGAVVVAAAGNESVNLEEHRQAPATLDGVLCVGSVGGTDRVSSFSNYGWAATTYAPGENPLSTYPGDRYEAEQGTSFSSPITAGVAALVRSVHPDWTPRMVNMQIRMTGDAVQGVAAASKPMYYSRVNAYRAVSMNNSWSSGDRTPGLYVKSYSVAGSGRITNYDVATVTMTIGNALADAPDATMQFVERDPYVAAMTTSEIPLGTLKHGEEKTVSLQIMLKPNFPWYHQELFVGVALRSATYTNYDQAMVEVNLPTRNSWNMTAMMPYMVFSRSVLAADGTTVWSTGAYANTPFYTVGTLAGPTGYNALPFAATTISAWNSAKAIIAGKSGANTSIAYTIDGGGQWVPVAIGSFATGISGMKHYSADSVIIVGSGKSSGGKIVAAMSVNGGQTWTNAATAPAQQQNETVPTNGVAFVDNNIFVVTSTGRVLRSTNRGGTWTSGGKATPASAVATGISFRDADNGLVVYRTGSLSNTPYHVANTTDGGKTWNSDAFDITASLGATPISVSSPGKHHILLADDGRVFGSDNDGAAWQVVLSQPPGYISWGQTYNIASGTVLCMAGANASVLRYRYAGPNGTRLLSIPEVYDFGTVDSAATRNDFIAFKSAGESEVAIDSMWVVPDANTPDSVFVLGLSLAGKSIAPGNTSSFRVNFNTKAPGTYGGTVYIKSNATPGIVSIRVTGVVRGTITAGVSDAFIHAATIYPNPAVDNVVLGVPEGTTRIAVIDVTGREVLSLDMNGNASSRTMLGTSDLPSGTYFLVWESAAGHHARTLSVQR